MLAPGTQVGRYVIKRKLAEGGMAEIFLASAVGPEGFAKDVVIKVVRSFLATDSQFVQMFIQEARLASRLNHANVVQIFDFGKHGDSYYLAMEYVRGASLWDLRKRCRELKVPFPPTLAAEIGAQVARGLQYAHALSDGGQRIGVVHRDVTPHNVLLSFDGAVKITDFGIAKATTTQTAPGMLKGKFAYMSPEQARGEKVDARTDTFAMGIVLWELLTGGKLFDGDSDLAVLRAVQESLIAPPARLNPDVPAELSDVVMKALARPLEERFQTAFDLERALATFVLRNAKSVEDTSVSLFLQQLFEEELAGDSAPPPPDDDYGTGNTVARPGLQTVTATPVGPPKGVRRGVMDDDDDDAPPQRTEEFATPSRPRTEQMPALKRPSRRLEPLPVQEPSIIVRPSMQLEVSDSRAAVTKVSSTEPASVVVEQSLLDDAPLKAPKSNTPLIVALSILVLVLLGAVGFVFRREPETLPEYVQLEPKPTTVATPKPEPTPAPTVAALPAEPVAIVDAGPVVEEAPPAPTGTPEPVKVAEAPKPAPAPAAARKTGTLVVKAVPFATVIVQGKTYEVTGVKTLTVPAGTYEVALKHPKKQTRERVTVAPNGSTNLSFSAE